MLANKVWCCVIYYNNNDDMVVMTKTKIHMLHECYSLQNTFIYFLSLVTTEAKKESLYFWPLDASKINWNSVNN